jgi:site-specific recombinase XerD
VCAGKDFEARRETAIITLLDTGARSGEFAGLTLSDVDFDLDVLLVLGKGRRERALPFGRTAALAQARVRHPQAHLDWLWLGKKG